jgi:hypothetical protein
MAGLAGLIPAIPIRGHIRAFLSEIAGTSAAMTIMLLRREPQ